MSTGLTCEINNLTQHMSGLNNEVSGFKQQVSDLNLQISDLQKENRELNSRLKELEARINKNSSNSSNSSKPPSTDGYKKHIKNTRTITGRLPGGQPGHEGSMLNKIDNPDKVIDLNIIDTCTCGCDLKGIEDKIRSRQVFDIPKIIVNAQKQLYNILKQPVNAIKGKIINSDVVHFDETGMRSEGKTKWVHVASTENLTYYEAHEKRGAEAAKDIGILPGFKGTTVHDHWMPYYTFTDCTHGQCNAHNVRYLKDIVDNYKQEWASDMIGLLIKIHRKVEAKDIRLF